MTPINQAPMSRADKQCLEGVTSGSPEPHTNQVSLSVAHFTVSHDLTSFVQDVWANTAVLFDPFMHLLANEMLTV